MTGEPNSMTKVAFQTGVLMEQRRILKLLEDFEVVGSDPITADFVETPELLELIKGENK